MMASHSPCVVEGRGGEGGGVVGWTVMVLKCVGVGRMVLRCVVSAG